MVGYISPVSLDGTRVLGKDSATGIEYLVDPRVVEGTFWATGANLKDTHLVGVTAGRDFVADGVLDVAEVREGDPAPDGSGPLTLARGIEMGHIFQLGRKYADALGLKVLDSNGKLVTVTMGSYGVGVSRAVAAVAETTCDDKGLCWPLALAPFQVQVVATGKDAAVFAEAERIAGELSGRGVDVLLDDRKASPGVKFADAEIMGMPHHRRGGSRTGRRCGRAARPANRRAGARCPSAEIVDQVLLAAGRLTSQTQPGQWVRGWPMAPTDLVGLRPSAPANAPRSGPPAATSRPRPSSRRSSSAPHPARISSLVVIAVGSSNVAGCTGATAGSASRSSLRNSFAVASRAVPRSRSGSSPSSRPIPTPSP